MYENWLPKPWETSLSNAKYLFVDSLHDDSAGLAIELGDYFNNIAIARFKVLFRRYAAYRNFDESYRLELWRRRHQLNA